MREELVHKQLPKTMNLSLDDNRKIDEQMKDILPLLELFGESFDSYQVNGSFRTPGEYNGRRRSFSITFYKK